VAPNAAPLQGRAFIATNLITDFPLKITDLALFYRIVTLPRLASQRGRRLVEFPAPAGAGPVDG
jgi:hypothetical protein